MNYAIYFNKKYKRVGHLWQGRFKSWYVTDEAYLYTLMLYIEQDPLKINRVKALEEYLYNSYNCFLAKEIPECLKNAWDMIAKVLELNQATVQRIIRRTKRTR
jgi:hypothetical protein